MNFEKLAWDDLTVARLKDALGNDLEPIRAEVEANTSQLYRTTDNNCHFVARREGSQLVIVALQGNNLRETGHKIVAAAKILGYESIRFHTQRPALLRLLREFQPEPIEYVVKVSIHG